MNETEYKSVPGKASAAKKVIAPKSAAALVQQAVPVIEPAMTSPAVIAAATVEPVSTEPTPAPAPVEIEPKGPVMTDTVNTTAEQTKSFATDTQNRATAMFSDVNTRAKAAMERSGKMFEEMNDFNKGNIEALVESSRVAAKAAEQLGQNAAETARKNFEQATAALKSFASVKTPTEFFQLQSDYARSAFDQMMAETSKNSETMLKLAGDVFQPLSNRLAVAAEKMKIAA
jgi:phasin family protein